MDKEQQTIPCNTWQKTEFTQNLVCAGVFRVIHGNKAKSRWNNGVIHGRDNVETGDLTLLGRNGYTAKSFPLKVH